MASRTPPLLARLRPRSGDSRLNSVVIALVVALVGAPAWGAARNECDLCPSTCPMHQHRSGDTPAPSGHLGCHGHAPGGSTHRASTAGERGPSVSCATCGHHGVFPATVLPPVILPTALALAFSKAVHAAPLPPIPQHDRLADPPDTPPPISAA
jgi:hypothetical protein